MPGYRAEFKCEQYVKGSGCAQGRGMTCPEGGACTLRFGIQHVKGPTWDLKSEAIPPRS